MFKLRKMLSMILAVGMVASMSTSVFATETDEKQTILDNYNNGIVENEGNMSLQNDDQPDNCTIDYVDTSAKYAADDRRVGEIIEKYNNDNSYDYSILSQSLEEADVYAVMYKIMEIYDEVESENEKNYLKSYFNSYAPYLGENDFIEFENSLNDRISAYASYSATAAINYTDSYWNTPNTSQYPYLNNDAVGTDCANFISQAVHAGGMTMNGDWYIYRKNTVYPEPETIAQLDYSWTLASPSPWISAREFKNFWGSSSNIVVSVQDYRNSQTANNIFTKDIVEGDVIVLLQPYGLGYRGYHCMLVNGYINSSTNNVATFQYAAHSRMTKTGDLYTAIQSSTYDKFKIQFIPFR